MKKVGIIIIIFLAVFLLVALVVPSIGRLPWTDNVNVTEVPKVNVKKYLIATSKFKSYKQNYTLQELKESKLAVMQQDIDLLPQAFTELKPTLIAETDLKKSLIEDYIVLLNPDSVDFTMKSLIIDGIDYWDKEADLTNYPLQIEVEIEASEAAKIIPSVKSTYFVSGEIIPARAVDRLSLNKNNNYTYLFDYFANDIKSADLSIALLENPINGDPKPCTGCMSFVGDAKNALGFKEVGYDIFSLAGNHAGDGGQSGYSETIKLLEAQGIGHTGTGKSDADKLKPAIKEIDGYRVGMISADTVSSYYWYKGSSSYGTNWFSNTMNNDIDYDRVKKIAQIKTDNNIDYMIAYMSWGVEYTNKATNFQTALAHALIDNGVDLVVSSHPHWVQNIEFYKGKPIFYALGNFVFDQNHTDPTREGANLKLNYLDHRLKSLEIMPHMSCGPYITSNNITDQYLQGNITMEELQNKNEKTGCVYFQAKRIKESDPFYKSVLDRMFQYSNVE